VGGRISFVLLHGAYFNTHPDEILEVWMGGLWWPGALLLAAAALWLYSRSRHLCLAELADNLLPLFHLLCFGAWLGCWLSGYAYGPASPQGAWWGIPAPDEAGVWSPRLPLQFLSMALFAGFTLIIETKQPAGGRRGAKASLNLAALGLTLLPLALFRMDYLPRLSGLRLDAWAAVLVFLSGAACWGLPLWLNARKSPSASNSQPG
jgi:phosphatidylglycerol:prolipoprotein diacylglycerol transferase